MPESEFEGRSARFDVMDVLLGLAPSLVEDLAGLAGSTRDDLLVSFQIMPWGDRATLAAFGLLRMSSETGNRGRVISVSPEAVDIVNAAHEVLSQDPEFARTHTDETPAHGAVLAAAAVPLVTVVDNLAPSSGSRAVPGRVQTVDGSAGYELMRVEVTLQVDDSGLGEETALVDVASWDDILVAPGDAVTLQYDTDSVSLRRPSALKVEAGK